MSRMLLFTYIIDHSCERFVVCLHKLVSGIIFWTARSHQNNSFAIISCSGFVDTSEWVLYAVDVAISVNSLWLIYSG